MRALTSDDFTAVLDTLGAVGGQILPRADLAHGATDALSMTPANLIGAAVWLATLTQESDHFRTTVEYGTGSYAPYVGRTFEQITWRDNYAAFGGWAAGRHLIASPALFVDHPSKLSETQWAWLGGVWFFAAKGLWPLANAGNFQAVENAVNRGTATDTGYPSGWSSRLTAYRAWTSRVVVPADVPVTGHMDSPTSRRLQQWVGVAMDGQVGSVTYSAIQKWLGRAVDGTMSTDDVKALQARIGALTDGVWGPGTTRDLQTYLNAHT